MKDLDLDDFAISTGKNINIIEDKKEEKKKKINKALIKSMIVLNGQVKSSIFGNVKSYIFSLYYNKIKVPKFDHNKNINPTYLFHNQITEKNKNEVDYILKTFLYMTYRSGFINMKTISSGNYSSDSGWGCMIRCCQMLLSKALIEKKIFELKKNKQEVNAQVLEKIRKEVLALFNDNYLEPKDLKDHPDLKNFWSQYDEVVKESPEYKNIYKVIPPYSIHILSKQGYCSGVFTSDMNMINVFTDINNDIFDDMNITNFCVGIVNVKKLFKTFCDEYNGSDKNNTQDIIEFWGKKYIFKKGGIVFVSFRYGNDLLDPKYYKIIPLIYQKFRNNLGMVGGNRKRGYYFIGVQGEDNLIIADPHFTQDTVMTEDKFYDSCNAQNLYLFGINEMRCQFSLCVSIFDSQQLREFLEDVQWMSNHDKSFIRFE